MLHRLKALPGFGDQKARIFLALLGKQRGVQPDGLAGGRRARTASDGARRSIADVTDPGLRWSARRSGRQGRGRKA